jgi:sn-glycerol 3-phosphate transport system ATP-binding protein
MADRMIVMNAGIAEQIGTPLEVYETPRTLFAAQFIGSPAMNIVDAEVKGDKILFGGRPVADSVGADGPVKLGVRPEHLVPDDAFCTVRSKAPSAALQQACRACIS